ncbi:hypothetical protein [Pseudoxanthomonas mexicana]
MQRRWMMIGALLVIFAAASLSLVAWWHSKKTPATSMDDDTGVVLMQGRPGYLHKILLSDTGQYSMTTECDVCDERASIGTWERIGESYIFQSSSGSVVLELVPDKVRGCDVLVPRTRDATISDRRIFYSRLGDACLLRL